MTGVLIAAGLFIIALFCYPPNALLILIFPFSRVLFQAPAENREIRMIVLRDISFVIIMMAIFRFLSTTFVIPWGTQLYHFSTNANQLYSLELSNNIFSKVILFASIMGFALRGIWDYAGHWVGTCIVLIFLAIACIKTGGGKIKTPLDPFL